MYCINVISLIYIVASLMISLVYLLYSKFYDKIKDIINKIKRKRKWV
jgi:hypothetical protein